jgi:murein hydrolase activator
MHASKQMLTKLSVLFLSLFFFHTFSIADEKDKEELTKQQLEDTNHAILKLQEELSKDKGLQKSQQNSLKKVEVELGSLNKKSLVLGKQKKIVSQNIRTLEQEEQVLNKKNTQQQQALSQDLRSIYKIGKQEKLKLLLNQENPEDLARILKYYDYYTQARVERILSYQKNIGEISKKRLEIKRELLALQTIESKIASDALKLKENQRQRQNVLHEINKNVLSKDLELKTLQENQTRLSKLLRSLENIWADIPNKLTSSSFKKRKGQLNYPVKGSVKFRFGNQRAGGRMTWNGWLINADMNAHVKAIYDGRVVFADWIRGYGLLIIVDHNDGFLSLYGHNASLLKETGDWISEGDILATVGNSGGHNDVGLYFEIREDGEPLNPESWLKK